MYKITWSNSYINYTKLFDLPDNSVNDCIIEKKILKSWYIEKFWCVKG